MFRAGEVAFAVGDTIRITNNGRDVTGKHRVDNGRIDTIRRFDKSGNIELSNGWVISRDFAHLRHGLVSTSPAAQSKDDEHSWVQVNRASLGAVGAEQVLVSLSRGKKTGVIFTDLSREELIDAIRCADNRISATELLMPKARPAPVAGPQAATVEGAASTAARPAAVGGRRPAVGDADGNAAARKTDARAWEFMQRVRGAYRHKDTAAAERKAARGGDAAWEFMQKVRGAYRQLRRKPAAMPKEKARASMRRG